MRYALTLHAYLAREIAIPFVGVLGLVLLLVAFAQLLQSADALLGLNVPWQDLCWAFAYAVIPLSGILLPISLFFAVLLALGRWVADREILGLLACGIAPWRLLPVPMLAGSGCALLAFVLALWGEPWGIGQLQQLWQQSARNAVINGILPQQLMTWDQQVMLYIGAKKGAHWQNIFVADTHERQRPVLIFAKTSQIQAGASQGGLHIALHDGILLLPLTSTSAAARTIVHFKTLNYALDIGTLLSQKLRRISPLQAMRFTALRALEHDVHAAPDVRIHASIVWQRKLAIPLSALIFAMLAVPLSLQPHSGARARSLLWGALLIAGYYYGGRALELAARDQALSSWWAVWLPNGCGIALFVGLWWRRCLH